jgi:hypothetical protein
MIRKLFYVLIIVSLFSAPLLAQQEGTPTTKVYDIKHKRADDIARLLIGYDSKIDDKNQITLFPGSINESFNTFTVRALPEGHAMVAEIIKKYDVPDKTIEFQFYLVKANTAGEGLKDGVQDNVRKALKDVASLTRYKGFELIDAPFVRTKEHHPAALDGKGIYRYDINILSPKITVEENRNQISIDNFSVRFSVRMVDPKGKATFSDFSLSTPFNIVEGEIVVLGASQIEREDKDPGAAIITIVTAKIL